MLSLLKKQRKPINKKRYLAGPVLRKPTREDLLHLLFKIFPELLCAGQCWMNSIGLQSGEMPK
jgi:hypothetical protein